MPEQLRFYLIFAWMMSSISSVSGYSCGLVKFLLQRLTDHRENPGDYLCGLCISVVIDPLDLARLFQIQSLEFLDQLPECALSNQDQH